MIFFLLPRLRHIFCACFMGIVGTLSSMDGVQAERVSNGIAVFAGLDKITGRTTRFEVSLGEVYQYGALQVTPRVCYTSSKDEPTRTTGFVEVNEVTLDKKVRRIFTGWMFADSPGLNAVEHPIYDVWLKDCKQSSQNLLLQ
ncbi:DUF2155 domain-containing protein [Bartonella henselae]|uniref:DUF2155 domain-containing protein n=5 Tax=Bartonella henselae TaxID=38323 RepID=A0A0H3LWB9_BARHE|nr:DUF2155 domain-containing protein [Bartonella henselae]ATP12195.1 hypothetical protein BhenCHDE101_03090 [Bartonella henselae]MDM9982685.1 DUF2155 domain-containing protein [Bartonella henselae]MDM9987459.1 DUF2155 domain-containing protein [Bartonella henselae]MDM9988907.1 DUF2155 domain-containing protein [Bartonella henselae]MDM9990119.1 DUF2155 domain-containing protein [Bartonella henselae]